MKIKSFVLTLGMLCIGVSAFAQHANQFDDGAGHYSTLKGSLSGGTYILNNGGGTILTTGNSLSNTTDNPIAGDNQGLGTNGLIWQTTFTGFVATFINEDNGGANRDGIQIALANNNGSSRALDITTGTNFNPTGGGGVRNEVFTVMNNGNITYKGGMIRGYLDVASGLSPAAPLNASVVQILDNGVAASPATITLPAGAANGSTIVLATNDPDGAQELTTGYAFSNNVCVRFVKYSSGWRPEF
jgi:hypothetical protein